MSHRRRHRRCRHRSTKVEEYATNIWTFPEAITLCIFLFLLLSIMFILYLNIFFICFFMTPRPWALEAAEVAEVAEAVIR